MPHFQKEGAILVFVPGWTDISALNRLLLEHPNYRYGTSVCHSGFPSSSLLFEHVRDEPVPNQIKDILINKGKHNMSPLLHLSRFFFTALSVTEYH
jgi:hypothetical protein